MLRPDDFARALEAASHKYEQPLAVMFQHRGRLPAEALESEWSPSTSAVVEVFRSRPAAHYAERTWRGNPRHSGGGFFAHLAIHYTDLACQLLGEPEQVHAIAETGQTPGIDVRATLTARMRGGALLRSTQAPSPRLARSGCTCSTEPVPSLSPTPTHAMSRTAANTPHPRRLPATCVPRSTVRSTPPYRPEDLSAVSPPPLQLAPSRCSSE
jgi:hypothetical protein